MVHTIERLTVAVDGVPYALAPLENADDLRAQVLAAVSAQGGFLTVTTDDGAKLSILVACSTSVTISARTVQVRANGAETGQPLWAPPSLDYGDDDVPFDVI